MIASDAAADVRGDVPAKHGVEHDVFPNRSFELDDALYVDVPTRHVGVVEHDASASP
jgi:hypothetical protein